MDISEIGWQQRRVWMSWWQLIEEYIICLFSYLVLQQPSACEFSTSLGGDSSLG